MYSLSNLFLVIKIRKCQTYFRELIYNKYSIYLPVDEIEKIIERPRPLTYAWFAMEDIIFKEKYNFGLRLLKVGVGFNFLSIILLLIKTNIQGYNAILSSIILIISSIVGLILVLFSLLESRVSLDSEKSALEFIARVNPEIYRKISMDNDYSISFAIQNYQVGKNSKEELKVRELILEIAGLNAIGGLAKVQASWVNGEDSLLVYCGLEEYLSKELKTEEQRETYIVIKDGFMGSLEDLIRVVKKI